MFPVVCAHPDSIRSSREPVFFGASAVFFSFGTAVYFRSQPPDSNRIQRERIFKPDRIALGLRVNGAKCASNLALAGSCLIPVYPISKIRSAGDRRTAFIWMVETHLISQGIALFCKGVFKRPRPYVYDPAIPLSKRFDRDASRSFFSSHATAAFNNAVMAGFLCDAARLPSKQKQFILAGGMTLAVSTGLLRVLSGRHFPTDVLAGAAVGWITASLIQPLHR